MRRAWGTAAALLVSTVVGVVPAAASAGDRPASPPSGGMAAATCKTEVAAIHRTARRLVTVPVVPGVAGLSPERGAEVPLPQPVTALATYTWDQSLLRARVRVSGVANDGWYVARRGIDQSKDQDVATPWAVTQPGVRAWGRMSAVVEAYGQVYDPTAPRNVYALERGGAVYRYAQHPVTDALGRRVALAGIPALSSLTLHSYAKDRDILLGTTPKGALLAVVVSGPARAKVGAVALRSRTWQSFDRLVVTDCGLLAIESAANRAAIYEVGRLAGARTRIGFTGWSTGPWLEWAVAPARTY